MTAVLLFERSEKSKQGTVVDIMIDLQNKGENQ